MNQPVIPNEIEMQQPESQRGYFKKGLQHCRSVVLQYARGTDPFYFKEDK